MLLADGEKLGRCGLDPCQWCDRDDWACRFCGGFAWWDPERPALNAGTVGWARVHEPCRMCGATGKEHNPLEGTSPENAVRYTTRH
jgi:hypothetical protein